MGVKGGRYGMMCEWSGLLSVRVRRNASPEGLAGFLGLVRRWDEAGGPCPSVAGCIIRALGCNGFEGVLGATCLAERLV